jgi:hypothetical protein
MTRVLRAAAVALLVELTGLALDQAGLSAAKYRLPRRVIKAGVGALGGALLDRTLPASPSEYRGS